MKYLNEWHSHNDKTPKKKKPVDEDIVLFPSGEVITIDPFLLDLIFVNRPELGVDWDKELKMYSASDDNKTKILELIDFHGARRKSHRKRNSGRTSQLKFNW